MNLSDKQTKFLELLFNAGEEIYASPDKYSSQWDEERELWKIYRHSTIMDQVDSETSILVGINPITGHKRDDASVTAYRSFMVELDEGDLASQMKYIEDSGLPYSACVFSGNKSLHFAITLDEDLASYSLYTFLAQWILKALPKCDQNTKNPSRGIRFPEVIRPDTDKYQRLLRLKKRISKDDLYEWLSKYPNAKPKIVKQKVRTATPNFNGIALWVLKELKEGINTKNGRNSRWYSIAWEFGLNGFSLDDTINILSNYFQEERDFTIKELTDTIKRAHKKASGDTNET